MAADLVTQDLHGKARFVAIQYRAMNQQASRLVDGDQVVISVENGQFFPHVPFFSSGNLPSR